MNQKGKGVVQIALLQFQSADVGHADFCRISLDMNSAQSYLPSRSLRAADKQTKVARSFFNAFPYP